MYSFYDRVRYSETGRSGKLDAAAIINYFQDCSTFQSEELGVGIDFLMKKRRVWVLNAWNIIFEKEVHLGENIRISTWPSKFHGLIGERDFTIQDEKGEICAKAKTIWAYVNMDTGHPEKVDEDALNAYQVDPPLDMPKEGRKVKMPDDMEEKESFLVRKSDLDTNHHVNNGKYVQMALEYLPDNFDLYQLRAEYRKSALYGNIIYPKVKMVENALYVSLCDETGMPYANILFRHR